MTAVILYLQIADIAEVTSAPEAKAKDSNTPNTSTPVKPSFSSPALDGGVAKPAKLATSSTAAAELICLDAASDNLTAKLDGFTLDDLNDDDFNPRAMGASSSEDEFDPRASANAPPTVPPPVLQQQQQQQVILSPPAPAVVAPVAPTADIFRPKDGNPFSGNPFGGANDPFGMASFDAAAGNKAPNVGNVFDSFQAGISVGGGNNLFEDLDPLKK